MLTKLTMRNFKRFGEVEIELGNPVVFIGPNNSGKTSAMQAMALWDIGVKRWNEKRADKSAPEKRPGVTVNRKDLFAIPHPSAKHLWRALHVRTLERVEDRMRTSNVRIDLVVEGIHEDSAWSCGLEFDYANEESFYCRPLRLDAGRHPKRMPVPSAAGAVRIALLPPMSGLATTETRLDQGAINVKIGEGRTAEVLRNLCFRVLEQSPDRWESLVERIEALFGARLDEPRYVEERGEITMGYRERGSALDLSSSGRGLQQTLLILAYMHANPGAVILLDEPDAHLEILRQREIYALIAELAADSGSQIIAASHSETLLNEASKDLVIAFVGKPHRLGGAKSQVRKALSEIGFDQYYQAEQTGWALYLEGPTDLDILRAFARRLGKDDAVRALQRPFVKYVGNLASAAERHFHGLRAALPDLRGVALFDRLDRAAEGRHPSLEHLEWQKREIESYLCTQETLKAYASASAKEGEPMPLFTPLEVKQRLTAMSEAIAEVEDALKVLGKGSPWSHDVKASDEFLAPLFEAYHEKLGLPNLMGKKQFHELAGYVPENEIDPEIGDKLDAIVAVAKGATPIASTDER